MRELHAIDAEEASDLRAWCIMPDHVHPFLRLTERLAIGQVVGRFKSKTRSALATVELRWQGNFFEHRLRPDESAEDVLRYLYLNPYRAKLVSACDAYPYSWISDIDAAWFQPNLDENRPFPEWLRSS